MSLEDTERERHVRELVEADRDLTADEEKLLADYAEDTWSAIHRQIALRTRATYAVAPQPQFRRCVTEHMNLDEWRDMSEAHLYHCPRCGLLLKDRGTVAASALLGERKRLRGLWKEYDTMPAGQEKDDALRRFITALGREQ